jgi:hypothetical protein
MVKGTVRTVSSGVLWETMPVMVGAVLVMSPLVPLPVLVALS